MPGFRQNLFTSRLLSDSDSSSILAFDAFNRFAVSNAAARQLALDAVSAGGSSLAARSDTPDNYQPVESAWYIPGPTALVDGVLGRIRLESHLATE